MVEQKLARLKTVGKLDAVRRLVGVAAVELEPVGTVRSTVGMRTGSDSGRGKPMAGRDDQLAVRGVRAGGDADEGEQRRGVAGAQPRGGER